MRGIILSIIFFLALPVSAQQDIESRAVYNKMMHAMEIVKTCKFELHVQERIFGKMIYGVHSVKLQTHPYKLYIKSKLPDTGAEVLYIKGTNNNKALINPNRFPFFNINLSPESSILRKNHHYVISQVGFGYLFDVLKNYEHRDKEMFYSKLKLKKPTPEHNYYILEIDNTDFGMMNYKVVKGENVTDIANKFFINDQMILELNRNVDYFDDVSAGDVITIPNSYARKIVFYLDKKTYLPLTQVIYDQNGLYSKIEFENFVLNPEIKSEEFTKQYKDYDF